MTNLGSDCEQVTNRNLRRSSTNKSQYFSVQDFMISKMERRSLNAFFISAVFLILLPPEGFSKECYTCSSAKSWEDCLENSQIFECEGIYPKVPAADMVCLSVVRSKLRTWNQQIVHYAKFCASKESCDEALCESEMIPREEYNITKARRCDIECCSEDKCNGCVKNEGPKTKNEDLRPCGLKRKPTGLKRRPAGLKRRPTGPKRKPTGLKRRPTGLKRRPCGLKRRPAGLKQRPTDL